MRPGGIMREAFSLCIGDLKRLFMTPKLYLAVIFMYFFMDNFVMEIKYIAVSAGIGVTPYVYPVFLSDWQGRMLTLLVMVFLMSDAPFFNGNEREVFIRASKKIWCLSKIIYVIALSLIFQIISFALSVIVCFPYNAVSSTWGSAIRTYAGATYSGSYEMVMNESPVEILLKELLISFFVCIIVGLIVMIFNIISSGYAGTVIVSALVVSDAFFELLEDSLAEEILNKIPFFWIDLSGLNSSVGYTTAAMTSIFMVFGLMGISFIVVKNKIEKIRER